MMAYLFLVTLLFLYSFFSLRNLIFLVCDWTYIFCCFPVSPWFISLLMFFFSLRIDFKNFLVCRKVLFRISCLNSMSIQFIIAHHQVSIWWVIYFERRSIKICWLFTLLRWRFASDRFWACSFIIMLVGHVITFSSKNFQCFNIVDLAIFYK